MARTQTMVQLNEDLIAKLDREAQRRRTSRSALIRDAVIAYLAQGSHDAAVDRYVAGYQRMPQAPEDSWGALGTEEDLDGHALARRLDREEREAGLSW